MTPGFANATLATADVAASFILAATPGADMALAETR